MVGATLTHEGKSPGIVVGKERMGQGIRKGSSTSPGWDAWHARRMLSFANPCFAEQGGQRRSSDQATQGGVTHLPAPTGVSSMGTSPSDPSTDTLCRVSTPISEGLPSTLGTDGDRNATNPCFAGQGGQGDSPDHATLEGLTTPPAASAVSTTQDIVQAVVADTQHPRMPVRAVMIYQEPAHATPVEIPVVVRTDAGSVDILATIDSGAMLNCVSAHFLAAHHEILGKATASTVTPVNADGTPIISLGQVQLHIIVAHPVNAVITASTFHVLQSDDDWVVLLGRPWLQQAQAIVDHGNNTLTLPAGEDTITISSTTRSQHSSLSVRGVSSDQFSGPLLTMLLNAITIGDDLTPTQKDRVSQLITSKAAAFATTLSQVEACPHTVHRLTIDPSAKLQRVAFGRPLTEPEHKAAVGCVDALLKADIIERVSPEAVRCVAPTVMAKKKSAASNVSPELLRQMANDALAAHDMAPVGVILPQRIVAPTTTAQPDEPTMYRMCHNFASINNATKVKPFPPGDLEAKVKKHAGKRWIIQLDALGAFYWIPVHIDSRPYLCFFVQGYGYFQYKRMPMGATGSPGTYQIAFQKTFNELLDPGPVSAWMDDLFASGDDFESLCALLGNILDAAIASKLRFCPAKTRLFVSTATLGGSSVSAHGVTPDISKVQVILDWPRPRNARDVLAFVNTAAVYRSFIKDFASIAKPLYDLTKGIKAMGKGHGALRRGLEMADVTSTWTAAHEKAWMTLRTCLTTFPVCVGPRWDRPFVVTCDASAEGFGGHLAQRDDNDKLRTVAWASCATSTAEQKLHSSSLELAVCKWVLDKFEKFTYGQPIILRTDCQAVRDMLKSDTSPGGYKAPWKESILSRWIISLEHTPGTANLVADTLSRSVAAGQVPAANPVQAAWEAKLGVVNDLYEVAVRRITVDENTVLLQRFEGDLLEDTVRALCGQGDIPEDELDDIRQAARTFCIVKGQLSRRVNGRLLTVLPAVEGLFVARDAHVSGGHFGRDLTIAQLNRKATWPGMRAHVDQVITTCPKCSQFGARHQQLLLRPVLRFRPFQTVAMDYLSMPPGRFNHDTILVAIDLFSKFVVAFSFKGPATGAHSLRMLDHLATNFLVPEEILTDNGTHFKNDRVTDWAKSHGCLQTFSAPYAHVGSVENANRLVLERLRRLCNVDSGMVPHVQLSGDSRTWNDSLHLAIQAINNRTLAFLSNLSPSEVLFGLASTRPWNGQRGDPHLRLVQVDASHMETTIAYGAEQQARRDRSVTWNVYQPAVGDLVQLHDIVGHTSGLSKDKLRPRWSGPFRITETRRRSARVENLNGLPRDGWVGWQRLRPWKGLATQGVQPTEE